MFRLMKLICLTVVILTLGMSIALAQQVKCAYCGGKITGSYIHYKGKYYHPSCFEKIAPRCDTCGEIIEDEYIAAEDGKRYHKECYYKHIARRCAFCGEVIEGKYLEADGETYHKECYLNHVAPRCDVCGEPIVGQYRIDFWGNKYHLKHEDELPGCDYCRRLICEKLTGGGRQYLDGRNICEICRLDAVLSDRQARPIIDDIQAFLAEKGIVVDMSHVPVKLVDLDELSRISGESKPKELGFAHYEEVTLMGNKISRKNTIYILHGLPRTVFQGVLSHEMMHVWTNMNSDMRHSSRLSEGSANYATYLVYSRSEDKFSEFLLENIVGDTDPIYGEGFSLVKNYVDQKGLYALLKYLQYHSEMR